jgi:hypothetical protein
MDAKTTVSLRDVRVKDAQALSRLRGTYGLRSADVFSMGVQLLELELNIQLGDADDKVSGVWKLIQHRRQQIIDRYDRAHDVEFAARGERAENARRA